MTCLQGRRIAGRNGAMLLVLLLTVVLAGVLVIVMQGKQLHAGENDGTRGAKASKQKRLDLPLALRNITREGCCGGLSAMKGLCFTDPAACNSTTYPFRSKEEGDKFAPWEPTKGQEYAHQKRCERANFHLRPPTRWCSSNAASTGSTGSNSSSENEPAPLHPFGCSRYSMTGGSGPYDRAVIFPEGKLIFCGIPKVSTSEWFKFLRFTAGATDYLSMAHYKPDFNRLRLDGMRPETQKELWDSRTWTRAVFIRDPAQRLLSAYLDKIAGGGNNVSFAEFVDVIANPEITGHSSGMKTGPIQTGLSWFTDPHWRPQAWSCNMSEDLPHIDYVGTLDRSAFHTKNLLERVGLWDSYGKHYRVYNGSHSSTNPHGIHPPALHESRIGFMQDGSTGKSGHHRNAQQKIDRYYSPELMEKVRQLYWMDFELWDAVQQSDGAVRGVDIAEKLKKECDAREIAKETEVI
mmetsp:Transcript_6687/g.14671  ORF Transcript_6687/g.14671 Transcript_6687/m.14671 type:complete len:463 (-) Transcript_6687:82-1470(-)